MPLVNLDPAAVELGDPAGDREAEPGAAVVGAAGREPLEHRGPVLGRDPRALVRDLVGILPERERKILVLRFVHEKTQSEIAAQLSISQMHVSRLLSQTLERLRERARVREQTQPQVQSREPVAVARSA